MSSVSALSNLPHLLRIEPLNLCSICLNAEKQPDPIDLQIQWLAAVIFNASSASTETKKILATLLASSVGFEEHALPLTLNVMKILKGMRESDDMASFNPHLAMTATTALSKIATDFHREQFAQAPDSQRQLNTPSESFFHNRESSISEQ